MSAETPVKGVGRAEGYPGLPDTFPIWQEVGASILGASSCPQTFPKCG